MVVYFKSKKFHSLKTSLFLGEVILYEKKKRILKMTDKNVSEIQSIQLNIHLIVENQTQCSIDP